MESCLFHSRGARGDLEHALNLLRSHPVFKKNTSLSLSPRKATCTCPPAIPTSLPPPALDLASAAESLRPSSPLLADFLRSLLASKKKAAAPSTPILVQFCLDALREQPAPAKSTSSPSSSSSSSSGASSSPAPPPLPEVVRTFELPIVETDVGVFIGKNGFRTLLAPFKERITVHCEGPKEGTLTITVRTLTEQRGEEVEQGLRTHAHNIAVARQRHRQALQAWAKKQRDNAEKRRKRVLERDQTEHRFVARLQNAAYHQHLDLKGVSTSHYQKGHQGRNRPKEVTERKKHQLSKEERREAHEQERRERLECASCRVGFSEDLAGQSCQYHSGYVLCSWKETNPRWNCCGAAPADLRGCATAPRHQWRHRKAEKDATPRTDSPRGKASRFLLHSDLAL